MIDIRFVLRGMESEELAGKFSLLNNVTVLRERTKQGVTNHKHGILHIPRGKLLSTDFQVNLFMNIVSIKKTYNRISFTIKFGIVQEAFLHIFL